MHLNDLGNWVGGSAPLGGGEMRNVLSYLGLVPLTTLAALSTGCPLQAKVDSSNSSTASTTTTTQTSTSTSSATSNSSAATVVSTGPKAIRIIFKQSNPTGSFDASPTNGTPATPGSGQQAVRFFNADGSLLAGATTTWLSSFEIGVSGSNNTAAKNPNCAKFADAAESSDLDNCSFDGGSTSIGCGAPNGLFRVSEYDCVMTTGQVPDDGTGGPSDGIYLRATFNRNLLGSGENIMAAIEYVAASYDAAPSSPTTCFSGGKPAPENCSNVAWKAYLKHSVGETVQPFLMLVPPTQNYVNTGVGTSGVSPQMKQFIIPLAGDPSLQVLQISRIHSNLDKTASATACYNGGSEPNAANSPLCAGIVIYSLTLYRI